MPRNNPVRLTGTAPELTQRFAGAARREFPGLLMRRMVAMGAPRGPKPGGKVSIGRMMSGK